MSEAICFLIGLVIAGAIVNSCDANTFHASAIAAHAAKWTIDSVSGKTEFKWINCEKP